MTEPYVERDGVIREGMVADPRAAAVPRTVQPAAAQPVVAEPLVAQPVVAEPVAAQTVVAQPVAAQPVVSAQPVQAVPVADVVQTVPAATVVSRRFWQFDPAAVLTALTGVALLLVGLIALTRAGLEGPLTEPVVEVLGFDHTAVLGMIEAVTGLLLLLAGVVRSREGAMFLATILGIGGVVAAVQAESFQRQLAIEEAFAWLLVAISLLVLLANLLIPAIRSRSTVYAAR